ncbi:helix-turn-helix domain-containing protein [Streptomyces syringium]|uniref:helix-turn-helix domain-containing protein n=1 Tax=Streptomyces syringium TaxID=76729 RepID=UPI0033F69976
MLLSCLGVTAEEEKVYRFLLPNGKGLTGEIGKALAMPQESVNLSVRRLAALGLVHVPGDGSVVAVDPAIGVERLIEDALSGLRARMREVGAARSAVSELGREFQRSAHISAADIEQVAGGREVWARLDELAFFARQEVMAIHPSVPWRVQNIAAARPLDMRCLRRGLTFRMVVVRAALQDSPTRAYVDELVSAGAHVRCVGEPVQRTIVYDRSQAVVPLDPGERQRGAVVVRQPGLVTGIVDHFERTWQSAVDIASVDDGPGGECPLSDLDKRVLEMLSRVDKDEVAARELGVSLRTFQRYVAHVMAQLGASTRFQAAMRAKERGWLGAPPSTPGPG